MNKKDWIILGELSDDYETFKHIVDNISKGNINIEKKEIALRIKKLHEKGYIRFVDENELQKKDLINNTDFIDEELWFGLTQKGAKLWEQNALKYGGRTIDWHEFCVVKFNYKNNLGEIYGVSPIICEKRLNNLLNDRNDINIDLNSVNISNVKEFELKYYKRIKNGCKLTFKFLPTNNK